VLKNLIRFSVDHAALVLVFAGILLAVAALRLPSAQVDIFPDLNAPTVVVMTEAPGFAADEVEQYITLPLESAAAGITGVRRVRTTSAIGLSIAYIEFGWGEDIYRARQLVSERLDTVREDLPIGAHAEMAPITSITGEIMLLAVSSPDASRSDLELRSYAEFDLRQKLLAVPGVAQIAVIGGELPEYQILIDQELLRLHDLSIEELVEAARASHSTMSAGYLSDAGHLEIPIRQSGRVRSVSDIAGTVIRVHEGAPLTIGQVAEVRIGPAPRRGTGADGGRPAVILTLKKAPDTNTLLITDEIDQLLDAIAPSLPDGIVVNRQIFRQADFIELGIHNVFKALRDASIIVSVILLLFLLNLRTTLVTLTALPLSLAAGLLALEAAGETINVMTLGGLAIAVGSLVDDAIIDVENVFRRLKLNALLPEGDRLSKADLIYRASNEIRPAMVFATLLIGLVFLPLMFMDGIEGRFFRPLGIAFVAALAASLVVALTVTPALCNLVLKYVPGEREQRESFLVRFLKRIYQPTLHLALARRKLLLSGAAVATGLTLWLASTFGTSFLPQFNEGTLMIGLFAPPGTSLRASDRIASSIEKRLQGIPGVKSVTRRTGRAERDEHAEPVSTSEIDVTLQPGHPMEQVRREVSAILAEVPGITSNVGQPIEHRLSHILSGTPAAIAISVYGDDLPTLRLIAREIETALETLPGARDIAANRELMIQSLPINYRPEDLAAHGLTPLDAGRQVRNALFGVKATEVNEGLKRMDVSVRLDSSSRDDVQDVKDLILRGSGGAYVRLTEVADIGPELTSNLITRENSQRKAVISLNVNEGANLGDLAAQVQELVGPIVSRHGCTVSYGGQFEAQRSATRTIAWLGLVVLLVMLCVLDLATGSLRVSLLVLVNLPLALIGGVLAIFIADSPDLMGNVLGLFGSGSYTPPVISIASLVGFIALFGIAVRNGILLVNHYRHLMEEEGLPLMEAIQRGSMERLVPILMTALTAALALAPLAMHADQPGNEILAPLSIVILGGLLTSTFLNLVLVPAGYAALHASRSPE
jgi:CzcA family heavy metal efflux pump